MEPLPSSPPSGGGSPLQLEECIEEVLKLTLISSIQGKLHTGLSNEFCANLLRDDPSDPLPTNDEVSKGVISYPLYKRLALSLYKSIHSGALCTAYKEVIPVHEDQSSKNKDKEWNKLIVGEGSALLRILKEVDFELDVQEPFFSQLSGVQIYRRFYSEEEERSNGVLAICVSIPTSQLYVIMASILSGLSYSGVQKLLGFVQTIGTNPESLPPPSSTLLSTFLAPNNPDV
ncbi:UNVERIFIED_CONTAM: hypothetical protein Slati_0974900 [Sesamum latifolium]|uniref:Uncharacterized protein n=1 Tax=Sesamum latifolium TaxID=2727402 RepID=A0AAW2XQC6_9LAMI